MGVQGSKASRAVLVTLLSVFTQCRAFGDGFEKRGRRDELVNMVWWTSFSDIRLTSGAGDYLHRMS